jgi:hypothetical protein
MGRTVLPYSHVLERERQSWAPFRRGLSKEDQEAFDRLFDRAKFHTHAAVYQAHSSPIETILFSITLECGNLIEVVLRKLEAVNCRAEYLIRGASPKRTCTNWTRH